MWLHYAEINSYHLSLSSHSHSIPPTLLSLWQAVTQTRNDNNQYFLTERSVPPFFSNYLDMGALLCWGSKLNQTELQEVKEGGWECIFDRNWMHLTPPHEMNSKWISVWLQAFRIILNPYYTFSLIGTRFGWAVPQGGLHLDWLKLFRHLSKKWWQIVLVQFRKYLQHIVTHRLYSTYKCRHI